MKYFLDQEFHEGFHKPLFGKARHFIDLISIGIVAEDGREYYAISKDFDLKAVWEDKWLRKNVLMPLMDDLWHEHINLQNLHQISDELSLANLKRWVKTFGKSNTQIRVEVEDFIIKGHHHEMTNLQGGAKVVDSSNNPIEIYGYYSAYDHVLFCSLFGRMIDLPNGFPMYCRDLKQMIDELTENSMLLVGEKNIDFNSDNIKDHPDYPKQENEHNALADAKWNLALYRFIKSI